MKENIFLILGVIFFFLFFFIVFVYLKKKKGKPWKKKSVEEIGAEGEAAVADIIGETKEGVRYVLNDYMVEDEGKSSQINHILINKYGVFVIETKNYSGRIYGSEAQREWTQVLNFGRTKNLLYSPVKQNATHIYRLKKLLPKNTSITSLIVMVQNNTEYIKASNIIKLSQLKKCLSKLKEEVLSEEEMKDIFDRLIEAKSKVTTSAVDHILEIHQMQKDVENNICPRCGSKLVLREGKNGPFYGCSSFPKCKFIKNSKR